ncbi:methionine-rich copper-binding protein CopC [Catenuloplanes nepalensis]|uniref:Methionine-rich copper-binding protein CopC n=1 Tax=Catenuloplanes nepalensis TaxID=587533 RepID=A0ABT9MJZ6_9ACTN|nr:copper resistance CopC family protein [Catenuloplanes nepalensis]MDP9791744.1 methionine-rich copper-binding protein CopC [Catenuloplanes nepalensis]
MDLRGTRWTLAVCAGLLAALAGASPALAHNSFTGSNPEDGATVEKAPKEIELRFLDAVDEDGTKITVTGPGGASGLDGEPRFDGKKVFAPLRVGRAGEYTVVYEIPSDDGHPVKGDFAFTLTEAAVAAAAPSPSAAPSSAAPSSAAPSATEAVPATDAPVLNPAASDSGDESTPWWPWAVGGVLLVIAIAGGTIAWGRRHGQAS